MVQKMWRNAAKEWIFPISRFDKRRLTMLDITGVHVGVDNLFCAGEDLVERH